MAGSQGKCPRCKTSNCLGDDNCPEKTMGPSQRTNRYLVLIVIGLTIIIAGIALFIFAMTPNDSDLTTLNLENILIGLFAMLMFIGGIFLLMIGIRLKRKVSNDTIAANGNEEESKQLRPKRSSSTIRSFKLRSTSSYSSASQDNKRSRCSEEFASNPEIEGFIKKKVFQNDTALPPKKPGSPKKFAQIKPNDVDSLVIFPVGYPEVAFNNEVLDIVCRLVFEAQLNLKTQYITLEEGYIKITHLKNTTREYFQRVDSKSFQAMLQTEIEMTIKVRPSQYFDKRISLSCVLEQHIEDDEFLLNMRTENDIDMSRCVFGNCESIINGFKVYFDVTPMSYKHIIDKGNVLIVNQREIEIDLVNNPFPEFFTIS